MNTIDNIQYVIENINNSLIRYNPWEHIIIDNFMPEVIYKKMAKEIFSSIENDEIKEDKFIKKVLYIQSKNIFPKEMFSNEYFNILKNKDVELALTSKLSLEHSHVHNGSQKIVDIKSTSKVVMKGFNYPIHQDVGKKLISIVHFFADNDNDRALGTRLYPPNDKARSYDYEKDCKFIAEYLPNRVLIFSPSGKKSFITNHAYCHDSDITKYRKSIQTFYLLK